MSVCPSSVHLLFVCPSFCHCTSFCMFISQFIFNLPVCLPIHMFVCLSVCSSVCLSEHLSVCASFCMTICQSVFQLSVCFPIHMFVCMYVCSSILWYLYCLSMVNQKLIYVLKDDWSICHLLIFSAKSNISRWAQMWTRPRFKRFLFATLYFFLRNLQICPIR
jgi:hypothetical protein